MLLLFTQASQLALECKRRGVLISIDGMLCNVIKIKPPMCFNAAVSLMQLVQTVRMSQCTQIRIVACVHC